MPTQNELIMLQSLPLEVKIAKTKIRIREWYEEFGGKIYISFSGGKDSTVLLHLVRSLYPDVEAVYLDTGLEYPEIREFVKTIPNVVWMKPKMNFKEVISKYGYPIVSKEQSAFIDEYRNTKSEKLKDIRWNGNKYGRGKISKKWRFLVDAPFKVGDKCCDIMKKNPAKEYEKKTGNHPIIGTMTSESAQRNSNYLMYGCNAFDKKRPTSQPISFWREQDVLQYIIENNIEYSSAYGEIVKINDIYITTKCERTGCMFCGFGCHLEKDENNRFLRLKETHPKVYEYCMKPIESGGLGMDEVLNYINIKH